MKGPNSSAWARTTPGRNAAAVQRTHLSREPDRARGQRMAGEARSHISRSARRALRLHQGAFRTLAAVGTCRLGRRSTGGCGAHSQSSQTLPGSTDSRNDRNADRCRAREGAVRRYGHPCLSAVRHAWAVARFLDRVRPQIAIVMETEIWPNLFRTCRKRGIPIVIASARLSEKSVRRYGRLGGLARAALDQVLVAAQTPLDCEPVPRRIGAAELFMSLAISSSTSRWEPMWPRRDVR